MSKLGRTQGAPIVKGSKIKNPDGTKYVVVRVSGSTVTADRVDTFRDGLESAVLSAAHAIGMIAGLCAVAYKRARQRVRSAAARSKAKHRPDANSL